MPPAASAPVLVSGATGTVGSALVRELLAAGTPVRAASTDPDRARSRLRLPASSDCGYVRLDFADPASWAGAYAGVQRMFLLRPPQAARVSRDLLPAVDAAVAAGVRRVVFLSVQGAGSNPLLPHRQVERWLERAGVQRGVEWTFLRAAYFMQNLTGVHGTDLRRGEIVVPAGRGRTSFVDAGDVAAVAALALRADGDRRHVGRAYTPTGPAALTYAEVADAFTTALGRRVRYTDPTPWAYARHARRELGMPGPMVAVTLGLYTAARLGLAAGVTTDVPYLLGRPARSVAEFAADVAAG